MARFLEKGRRVALASVKLWAVLLLFCRGCAAGEEHKNRDWDLAVAVGNRIELLESDGTSLGATATVRQFTELKALSFDGVRHRFIVSDSNGRNDSIYTVALSTDTKVESIVQELSDYVQGLAIDPIDDILYWTDSQNNGINYVSLNGDLTDINDPKTFMNLSEGTPQDIVIDVCTRYIYWTNSDPEHPTVERAYLNGSNHQILIDSGITRPVGITIDHKARRLYWTDMSGGHFYRIDSSSFDGKERETVYEGTLVKPFGIAVDDDNLYFTDIQNAALWRLGKGGRGADPAKIKDFGEDKPLGLIAKNTPIRGYPDCKVLEEAIEKYEEEGYMEDATEVGGKEQAVRCFNGGQLVGNRCNCPSGYSGDRCEQRPKELLGQRFERKLCKGYCLNEGACSYDRGDVLPRCNCPVGFGGSRCEIGARFEDICSLYCKDRMDEDILVSKENDKMCRCTGGSYVMVHSNVSFALPLAQRDPTDPDPVDLRLFLKQNVVALVFAAVSLVSVVVLIGYVCANRRKPPRIRKRYIINKNMTPLNSRPQPATEQCEITIENCCNMNVCETPCFEPPKLRGFPTKNKEDKNKLLPNDDEDLY